MSIIRVTPQITISKDLINAAGLARILGVSRQYVSAILNGKKKAPAMRKRINEILKQEIEKSKAA